MPIIKIACKGHTTKNIDDLESFQGNLKDLSEINYKKLRAEILELGFCEPISLWKNKILNGHQRLRVLKKMRSDEGIIIPQIPVNIIDAPNIKTAKKIVLALTSQYGNITDQGLYEFISNAELDFDEIKNSFHFPEIDFDNFDAKFIDNPTEDQNEKENDVPDIDKDRPIVIKIGDIIEFGNHKFLCGNCTIETNVQKLMGKQKVDMVFTDSPYGVNYGDKNKSLNKIDEGNRIQTKIINDDKSPEDMFNFWKSAFNLIGNVLKEKSSYYICSPQGGLLLLQAIDQSSLMLKHTLIWNKNRAVLGRSDYNYKHEMILFGWLKKGIHKFFGNGEFKTSVWDIANSRKSDLHPTMKPIKLMENAILNSTAPNSSVFDPFLGSGSTLIACEKTNRKCFGMEIEPFYCDVIITRWCEYTGINNVKINGKEKAWPRSTKQI